ncbi:hypothetical protein Sme01_29540 [Sphaerisporangium melleum]|uniref:Histidine kinase/HSP90-like ATPase domain-containing protein n=1 Tax=Sphaerisporangium melleum TaxID=321316 RepID=A0A917R2S5_9ACTN|nr:ATP-binding protein [Sphaerisporangium melleum]GGK84968.1 hypothetical protein GCM10007964_29310 [Sphaerisporangium melleum]GII70478.1 hypothetical protein Sme01_29540 [Sphaerisporangium melleum]
MGGGRAREQYLEIKAEPEAASHAREHVRRVLSKWCRQDILETAELIASELATNAVKATWEIGALEGYAGPGHIWIDLHQAGALVVLEVWDAGRSLPRLKAAAPDDEGGRGLWLVNALAARWGCRYPLGGGKIIWCAVAG